jgi:hypothetical protein
MACWASTQIGSRCTGCARPATPGGSEHGREQVAAAGRLARRRGALGLRLRCAADLPANEFWRALGFEPWTTSSGSASPRSPSPPPCC